MATDYVTLTEEIAVAMEFLPSNVKLEGFAQGVLEELTTAASASYGVIPTPHTISGMVDTSMADLIKDYSEFPEVTQEIIDFCAGVIQHINDAAIVTYGNLPPSAAVPPNIAWMIEGVITGLSGDGMADAVTISMGHNPTPDKLKAMCGAICDHITDNGEVNNGSIA